MDQNLLQDVNEAKQRVERAEEALDALLGKLQAGPRAEKVAASGPLETALQRLHEARKLLASLELDDP